LQYNNEAVSHKASGSQKESKNASSYKAEISPAGVACVIVTLHMFQRKYSISIKCGDVVSNVKVYLLTYLLTYSLTYSMMQNIT